MNAIEMKMVDLLIDLKENYHAAGVKANFESSGMQTYETMRLKEITMKAGLNLTIKIGGCEAITDMREARAIGAERIAAPMVSCPFALSKFINAIKFVFPSDEKKLITFLFYIETIDAYNNLNRMLETPNIEEINGLVIGREDLVWSMGFSGLMNDDYNNSKVLNIMQDILTKAKSKGLETAVGGGITCEDNLKYLKKLPHGLLNSFQTKMVRFNCPGAFEDKNARGILKASEFELLWLNNKSNYYETISKENLKTIRSLETRIKSLQ